jgi:hypothetical protein
VSQRVTYRTETIKTNRIAHPPHRRFAITPFAISYLLFSYSLAWLGT